MKMSIFTPTYNTGDRISRTYLSVLHQSHRDWEWVICDDGSDDETKHLLRELSWQDPRVKVALLEHRGSIGHMKRECTERCTGDILVELDHDDRLVPTTLAEIAKAADANPLAGMFYSNFAEVMPDGSSHQYDSPYWAYKETHAYGLPYMEAIAQDVYARVGGLKAPNICYWTLMPNHVRAFRRQTLIDIGGYDASLPVADDYDLIWRFYLHSYIVHIPKLLYLYTWGGNTWTGGRNAEIQRAMAAVRAKYAIEIGWKFDADDMSLL